MKPIKIAFHIHLEKIAKLLHSGASQKNPAIWLYLNDLRTPFFMLEALSRIAYGIYDKKSLENLKEQFKYIEDAIGAVDHYVGVLRQLEKNKAVDIDTLDYFKNRAHDAAADLNDYLHMFEWITGDMIINVDKELKKIKWKDAEKETAAIEEFYQKEINECTTFANETKFHFDNVEEDVHELRRKLRWLSIYPQALQGVFQYHTPTSKPKAFHSKYHTKEIVMSPYNAMPDVIKLEKPIKLEKNSFLSLSWLIYNLGELKDNGLNIEALVEAFQNTDFQKASVAETNAYAILGKKQLKMQGILDGAESICSTFFSEKHLDHLLLK